MGGASSAESRTEPTASESSKLEADEKLLQDAVGTGDRTLFGGWISMSELRKNGDVIWAVLFFMLCSSSMLLVNKLIMGYWNLPVTITLIQLLFACITLCIPQLCFKEFLRVGSWNDAWRWLRAVPLLFAIMLATSMLALKYSTTGAVVVTRNVAPLFALIMEAIGKEKVQVDVWTVMALVYTLGGVVLYMLNDLQFSLIGLTCMLINMVSAVGERIVERRLLAVDPVVDASKMALVLLTNLGGLFYVTFLLIPTQETSDWDSLLHTDEGAPRPMYQYVLLLVSCVAGVAIGYAGINAQRHLTATSFLVVGNVNKFVVIFCGMAFMSESSGWQAILGCIIAITGGVMYALARNRLADKVKAQKALLKKQDTAA
jgi:drug/metabolite transporter (DMT)-like permease